MLPACCAADWPPKDESAAAGAAPMSSKPSVSARRRPFTINSPFELSLHTGRATRRTCHLRSSAELTRPVEPRCEQLRPGSPVGTPETGHEHRGAEAGCGEQHCE